MKNNMIFGVICAAIAVIFVICISVMVSRDDEPPVITIGTELTQYKSSMKNKKLLADVTAYDEKDGNVTDSLIVKSVVTLSKGNQVKITYAAKDSSNNVAIAYRVLDMVGGKKDDKESETETKKKNTSSNKNKVTTESASEDASESISEKVSETVETTAEPKAPENIDKDEVKKTGIPAIALKETEFTIKVGGEFNILNHIAETYDDKDDVSRRVQVTGDYDVKTPGDYKIVYCVTDKEGHRSKEQVLTLHVVE